MKLPSKLRKHAGPVACGVTEGSCTCARVAGHEGPHVCDCQGAWYVGKDGSFEMFAFPYMMGSYSNEEAEKVGKELEKKWRETQDAPGAAHLGG